MQSDKSSPITDDLYSSSLPFLSIHVNYDLSKLPQWVRENIDVARVYGHENKGIILPDGRKYHLNNTLNDMNGRDWTLFINSVFTTHYPTKGKESFAHEIRKIHPTPKPPQLTRDIIKFFTKENELVFDCFMGVGGSLLGAALCNRKAAGIDINRLYIDTYKKAARQLNLPTFQTECGNCLELLKKKQIQNKLFKDQKISLLLIDPPYFNMMSKEKTGADKDVYGNKATPFSNNEFDLGNMDRVDFFKALRESVELVIPHIKFRGYIVIFIKDLQPSKKETNLLHAEVIQELNKIPNLNYKGMKIWADTSSKMYPYGYPFSFVANQIHQYILIFRKEF